jgi:hypothetical protein
MTTFVRGNTLRQEITEVAAAMEQATGKYGRGLMLIRDGTLHFGVRPGPIGGTEPIPLTPSTGLVEVASAGVTGGGASPEASEPRRRFTLILKGRPDLKPGAVVEFDVPPTERAPTTPSIAAAIAGPLLGPTLPSLTSELTDPMLLYVDSVSHRLSRTASFVTTVTGVEVSTVDDLYDPPPEAGTGPAAASGGTDSAVRAARAVQGGVREALARLKLAEAGEVRLVTSTGDGSADEPPRHTATVWRGLVEPDGHPNRLARLAVRHESPDVRERVPHVTPFAWGSTGLVVPRYPGTRVLLSHGRGAQDDPVDIGALWESGTGPDAEPGDWWLILPVGVASELRTSLADDAEPEPHTGSVTQDLIDADGNRVIEVGELTIRVTRDALASAGTRPERAGDADSVTIEHADAGSKIVMLADGTVRIQASRIEFDAGSDGEISLTAKNVTVSVADSMDVS